MPWQLSKSAKADELSGAKHRTCRRWGYLALATCGLALAPLLYAQANAQSGSSSAGSTSGTSTDNSANVDRGEAIQVDLATTLKRGLRARRPQEFRYLEEVAQMVSDGELPESLVRTTFGWARTKRPYPFQYFQRALQVRAKRLGISLPTV